MTAIVYPASLPAPSSAPLQWAERRQLSSLPGPRGSRILWTDRLGSQPLEFILRSETQVQTWVDWVRDDLEDGAAWFAASWPQPQGGVGVRRFIGAPSYPEYLPVIGAWRVSALCEVRGRGMLPDLVRDPLWDSVVLLIQNGLAIDQSRYARSLSVIGGVSAEVDDPAFPSGKSLRISGPIATSGLSWFFNAVSTPELRYGSDPVCIETMVRLNNDTFGGQILYGDEHGFRSSGILLAPGASSGLVRCDLNTPAIDGGFSAQPPMDEAIVYHLALQIIPGVGRTLYLGGIPYAGTGEVTPASLIDPVSTDTPPCIGRMGGVEGSEDFNYDQYRITAGPGVIRYSEPFDPPTNIFPTR